MAVFKKIIAICLCLVLLAGTLASCDAGVPGPQGEQGVPGEKGEKGDTGATGAQGDAGRGIYKTEIIDGYLWITYTDDLDTPVNVGKIEAEQEGTDGLDFYPLPDGTYAVAAGKTKYLAEIIIPATYKGKAVTKILEGAFSGCSNLTSVTIGEGVTSIGYEAFASCDRLTSITVEQGNPKYYSVGNCVIETATKTLILGCKNSVIPSDGSVTSIGEFAFYYCDGLTSLTIPNSVMSIDTGAFWNSYSLTSVTISNSVTSIGYKAFYNCSSLTSVTFENTEGWTAGETKISSSDLANASTAAEYLKETYSNYNWTRN